MPNNFKSYKSVSVTTESTIITGPALTETTIIGLSVANTGAGTALINVKINTAHLGKDIPLPVGSAIAIIGGDQKQVLEAGDTLKVSSDVSVDVVASVLEIT